MTTFLSLYFLPSSCPFPTLHTEMKRKEYRQIQKKEEEERVPLWFNLWWWRFSYIFVFISFLFSSRNWMTELCSNFLLLVNARQRIVRRVESIFKNYKKEKKRLLILFRLFLFDDVALEIRCSSNRWCFFWKHVGINIERDRLVEEYKNPGRIC